MSVIEASSVRVSTLADGTLRLVVDIEPRHANSAFALFGSPGVPMALAALQKPQEQPEKPLGGPLSQWLAIRCGEEKFQSWLGAWNAAAAASEVRRICGVSSRAEIDHDEAARQRFEDLIRGPWMRYCAVTT
jgi:hypothetical protein